MTRDQDRSYAPVESAQLGTQRYFSPRVDQVAEPISDEEIRAGIESILHPQPLAEPPSVATALELNHTNPQANRLIGEFVVKALVAGETRILDHDYFLLKRTGTDALQGPIGSYAQPERATELAQRFTSREQTISPNSQPKAAYEAYTFWGSPIE